MANIHYTPLVLRHNMTKFRMSRRFSIKQSKTSIYLNRKYFVCVFFFEIYVFREIFNLKHYYLVKHENYYRNLLGNTFK